MNRTRKKYKINREQNRDPTTPAAAAAVSGQKPTKKVEVEETKGDDLKQLLNFSVDSLTTH